MKKTVFLLLIAFAIGYSGCKKCYNCQTNYNTIARIDSVPSALVYDSVHHVYDTVYVTIDTVYNPHGTIKEFQYCGTDVQQYPYIGSDSHHYAPVVTSCYY
jgi:hypothetical protein